MNETKRAVESKGVWGGVIATISGLAALGAVVVPAVFPEAGVSAEDVAAVSAPAKEAVLGAAAVLGGILSIVGRIKARKKITL